MKIKDTITGQIFEYGSNSHHALRISDDGKMLAFENLQNGDDSEYGNYRFVDDCEEVIPSESECSCRHGADSYFKIGGFAEEYNNGWIPCEVRLPEEAKPILICTTTGIVDIATRSVSYEHNAYRTYRGYVFWDDEIIAWQSLPAPYKKGE